MQQVLMHMLRVQCYMYLYILYNESEMKPQFGTFLPLVSAAVMILTAIAHFRQTCKHSNHLN